MNPLPVILVCSADDGLIRPIAAAMHEQGQVVRAASLAEAEEQMTLHAPSVVAADVRCDDLYRRLDEWLLRYPDVPVIVIGESRSDRVLALERVDVFAVASPDSNFQRWQDLLRPAIKHHHALSTLRLRGEPAAAPAPPPPPPAPERPPAREGPSIITRMTSAFRHFEHVDLMLDRAMEELAAAAHTPRAGLFTRDESTGRYRLRTGLRYLKETAAAAYESRDPLVLWFERHAHMVTRVLAGQMPDPGQRQMLLRVLDIAGAEVMVPLHARGQLLGWFFVGHQATGQPYTLGDLQELSIAGDYLSMLLENAMLYREVTVQKTVAETLLHALPTGIVAVDSAGAIRWFSTSAEQMFNRPIGEVISQPIEKLGGRMAHALRSALKGEGTSEPASWDETASGRYLRVEARRLGDASDRLGALAIIQDLTSIRHLEEKQAQLERTAFWNDLAAGLSHEIRNPLVAIRTFAQLLPERYQDEEFRQEFSTLVAREVDRLNGIIEQINGFANPRPPAQGRVDVRTPLRQALARVFPAGTAKPIKITERLDGNLPLVPGDEQALADCFTHLLQNAAEALEGQPDAAIDCAAEARTGPGNEPIVQIVITDNGKGIAEDVRDKAFSPFYTTKARGMGLGLPIVQRTVIEHNGRVQLQSTGRGARVVIELPAGEPAASGRDA